MEIIDNSNIAARRCPGFSDWIDDLLVRVRDLSKRNTVVRLTTDRNHYPDFRYQLYNSQGKTYVGLSQADGLVTLQLFQRDIPDPEFGFKPAFTTPKVYTLPMHRSSLLRAATLVQPHLDQDTPYASGSVRRIRVTRTPKVVEPWTFCGGRVTGMTLTPTHVVVQTDNGLNEYLIPHEKMEGHRPGIMKYIVFNEDNSFAFISSSEFEIYFQLVE